MPDPMPIPKEFRTVSPTLVIKDAAKASEFYQKAFGAEPASSAGT